VDYLTKLFRFKSLNISEYGKQSLINGYLLENIDGKTTVADFQALRMAIIWKAYKSRKSPL
jgi:hypothetical protein